MYLYQYCNNKIQKPLPVWLETASKYQVLEHYHNSASNSNFYLVSKEPYQGYLIDNDSRVTIITTSLEELEVTGFDQCLYNPVIPRTMLDVFQEYQADTIAYE